MPLVFMLNRSSHEPSYIKIADYLKSRIPNWNSEWIILDFESASRNAFRKVFPFLLFRVVYFILVETFGVEFKN